MDSYIFRKAIRISGQDRSAEKMPKSIISAEIVIIAYDYSDDTISDYIGVFLDENLQASWMHFLQQLITQYGEYVNADDAVRVRIRQSERETLSVLTNGAINLAKIAFNAGVQRDGEAVEKQLAEYHTDAIRNTSVRTIYNQGSTPSNHLQKHYFRDWNLPKDTGMG